MHTVIEDGASQDPVEGYTQTSEEGECQLCGGGGLLILCDECNGGFHLHCIGLVEVPEGTCSVFHVSQNVSDLDCCEVLQRYIYNYISITRLITFLSTTRLNAHVVSKEL